MSKRRKRRSVPIAKRDPKIIVFWAFMAVALVAGAGMFWATSVKASNVDTSYTSAYTPNPPAPAPAPLTLDIKENPRVLFIGDSFTEGNGSSNKAVTSFVALTASMHGWSDYMVSGVGLTGFLRPGVSEEAHRTYGERLTLIHDRNEFNPDLIIFQGGLNDSPYPTNKIEAAVRDTLNLAKGLWPDAELVLIGPITARSTLENVNAAYGNGAWSAKTPFVDAHRYPMISMKENESMTIGDKWHPNDAGHLRIAEELTARLATFALQTN